MAGSLERYQKKERCSSRGGWEDARPGDRGQAWAARPLSRYALILAAVRRLASLLATGSLLAAASACDSSHSAHNTTTSDDPVPSRHYSGRLYSVGQVTRAFAALGLELHIGAGHAPGYVSLLNNARLGPQHLPSPPRLVTVEVATRRSAAQRTIFPQRHDTRVTRYANVTVFSKPYVLDQVRAAVSALRWGTASRLSKPGKTLIVPGRSMGPVWVGEPRTTVERKFGRGHATQRGIVSYFGGHLLVNYWFHDGLYKNVEYLQTRWPGYRTRSGAHVGSSRRELRSLYMTCREGDCWLMAGPPPDAPGALFAMRHGQVVAITIGHFG